MRMLQPEALYNPGITGLRTNRILQLVLMLCMLASFLTLPKHGQCQTSYDAAMQAYTLRMQGKSDEAKAILEKSLQQDPGSAVANFEMARLLEAANPLNIEEILHYCDQAVANEPQNVFYAMYRARTLLLKAYIAMHQDDTDEIRRGIDATCAAYQHVLELDPGCTEAMLYLEDIYANLPTDMGGDSAKAETYAMMLAEADPFYGAQGKIILARGEMDVTDYWQNYLSQNGENLLALEFLGRAYLMKDDIAQAESCFDKIIRSDPSRQILVLDLARAHLLRVMQGKGTNDTDLAQARKYFDAYLNSDVEKPVCIEAWCYGFLSRIEMFTENKEASEKYLDKANALCPTFSRAFAVPSIDAPPDALTYSYSSFFTPF